MRKAVALFGLAASSLTCVSFASAQQPAVRSQSVGADTAHQQLRLYLSPIRVDSGYRLTSNGYSGATHVEQTVNFTERADSARVAPVAGVAARVIDTRNAVQFVSPQLAGPFEVSGSFSGRLDFITNERRFDFQISLYELTSSDDYFLVATYSTLVAAVRDTSHQTLQPLVRQHLDFESADRYRRQIQNGSRLVVLITLLRQPALQIDSATMVDANEPLRISWYGESYIELHVRRR